MIQLFSLCGLNIKPSFPIYPKSKVYMHFRNGHLLFWIYINNLVFMKTYSTWQYRWC